MPGLIRAPPEFIHDNALTTPESRLYCAPLDATVQTRSGLEKKFR
jgi:hypothetical protein